MVVRAKKTIKMVKKTLFCIILGIWVQSYKKKCICARKSFFIAICHIFLQEIRGNAQQAESEVTKKIVTLQTF